MAGAILIAYWGCVMLRGLRIVATLTFAAIMPAFVHAADLAPVFKAPSAAPVPLSSWAGFYIGVQGGYGWGHSRQSDETPFDTRPYTVRGALAGITWGYNWQAGPAVIGVEGDAAWASIKGSTIGNDPLGQTCSGNPPRCDAKLKAVGTSRLRLGYAHGSVLPYITGGLAWGLLRASEGDIPANGFNGSDTRIRYGWAAGAGIEAIIAAHWSAKVEYIYVDLGRSFGFLDNVPGGFGANEIVRFDTHIVRGGVNYHFDPARPFIPMFAPSAPAGWSGLYVGAATGGGFGHARTTDPTGFDSGRYGVTGGIAGALAGYNHQVGQIVLGLEGDLSYASIEGRTGGQGTAPATVCLGAITFECNAKLRWLATARGRAGVAWDRFLPYVTAGVAIGSLHAGENPATAPTVAGSGTDTRVGWTAGGGVEIQINRRWSSRFDYLYVDLGDGRVYDDVVAAGTVPQSVRFHTSLIRTGLNYRFEPFPLTK